jgi:hypothetical protein
MQFWEFYFSENRRKWFNYAEKINVMLPRGPEIQNLIYGSVIIKRLW